MKEQQTSQWLELADAGASVPGEASTDLAERAIRRGGRRTAMKRTGLAVVAVHAVASVIVLGLIWVPDTPVGPSRSAEPPVAYEVQGSAAVTDGDRELAELRARVAAQEAVIEALLVQEQKRPVQIMQAVNPLNAIHDQVDLAAKQLVLAAARIEQERGHDSLSTSLYTEVITNFPDSAWAAIARERIDESELLTEPRSAL